ncbi:sensor histidine kinase [Aestuariimicrobium ganziense]|uniref:sensor histidine kinase n=1 Tax=Aestuariimicrobium ganziense TaxID=2773677 RepID=UPI0038B35FDC
MNLVDPWLAAVLGIVVGVVVTIAVVASRRHRAAVSQAEQEPQVHEHAAALLGVLRSGGMIVGPHDHVLRSNPQARSWGLSRGDRIAHAEVLDLVRSARRDDRAVIRDLDIRRGVGTTPLRLTLRVAPLGEGTMVALAEDRSVMLRADETRRDFVTNVSHELKTPIGAISLMAEAVLDATDDPETVQHFAERINIETGRLGQLVTQIINLSRLQADDPMLDPELIQLPELVAEAIDRCQEQARKRRINVVTAGDDDVVVMGELSQLSDAVTNLVQNAIAYSDEGGRVAVSHRLVQQGDEPFVEIAVADNGIGIRPEDQERIFERFYRVDYGRSRASGGTGLGLAIVKHVVSVHGGTINVWSRPGQGSTFTITLPAPVPEALPEPNTTPTRKAMA